MGQHDGSGRGGSLAYFLNFERASQSPAAGGTQAGGDCKKASRFAFGHKELKDGLRADPVNGVLFIEIGVSQNFTCFGLRFKSGKPSRPPQAHPIHMYVNNPCPVSGHFSGADTARTAGQIKELLTAIQKQKVPYVFWTSLGIA